ncbi:MAG: class I SAM-dependent methyltransferase [Chloroflexota bacterium]
MTGRRSVLDDQIDYYRARAGEYDEWFYRKGRYDHGAELNQLWFEEADQVRQALRGSGPVETALELACGTGIWTEELAQLSRRVTAVDAAAEMLDINRARLANPKVAYVRADLFEWQPTERYDLVFFSFWLSHVPPERLNGFVSSVRRALKPDGRVFLIDSRRETTSTARDQHLPTDAATQLVRRLNDGRQFTIVKVFYEPDQLATALVQAGFDADVRTTHYFIYATARFPQARPA